MCHHTSSFPDIYENSDGITPYELVQTHAPPRALRCSDAPTLVVPRIHTELARCAPADIRLCENILTFKRHLKTHLFQFPTHLVLLCCIKRLCIFGLKGAIQIRYYYYYYYYGFVEYKSGM